MAEFLHFMERGSTGKMKTVQSNVKYGGSKRDRKEEKGKWRCLFVCKKTICSNLILYTSCLKLVHTQCNGVKGSLYEESLRLSAGVVQPVNLRLTVLNWVLAVDYG